MSRKAGLDESDTPRSEIPKSTIEFRSKRSEKAYCVVGVGGYEERAVA